MALNYNILLMDPCRMFLGNLYKASGLSRRKKIPVRGSVQDLDLNKRIFILLCKLQANRKDFHYKNASVCSSKRDISIFILFSYMNLLVSISMCWMDGKHPIRFVIRLVRWLERDNQSDARKFSDQMQAIG